MQPLISPPRHQFVPCQPAPRLPAPRLFVLHLFVPRLPRCCRSLPLLLSPRLPRCGCPATAAFGYRSATRTATLPAWSEMPPRPVFLQLFYGTSHSRSPSLLCPGHKKGGRNRTEVRPPPKSNQSVAAASPRQVIWLSGKSPFLKVGIRTPGNTRSSPAPKRTVFRYRAALRKVHHQANKATSRRSRTDN